MLPNLVQVPAFALDFLRQGSRLFPQSMQLRLGTLILTPQERIGRSGGSQEGVFASG